jgi:hypothetical protein
MATHAPQWTRGGEDNEASVLQRQLTDILEYSFF